LNLSSERVLVAETQIDAENRMHVISQGDRLDGIKHASTQLSPPPVPTPQTPKTGITLDMPAHNFAPGDSCYLKAILYSGSTTPTQARLFVILQIGTEYWFHPAWTHDANFEIVSLSGGVWEQMIIPQFTWPDTGSGSLDGIVFWGAMLDVSTIDVIGGMDGISSWSFGFGPG